MLSCESCQNLFADALYDSLDAKSMQTMADHLETCVACEALYADLQQATRRLETAGLKSHNFDDIPERAALDGLWDNLQPALDRIDAGHYRQMPRYRKRAVIGGVLAMAASVVLTIALLPLFNDAIAPASPQITMNELISPELMNYLARAEVMLLLVANAETDSVSAVPVTSTFARDLALEANVLNASSENTINSGQSRLLKDIEFMLLQIANLDESNMEQGVQLLQQFLEDNSVLFKIRLLEMRNQEPYI